MNQSKTIRGLSAKQMAEWGMLIAVILLLDITNLGYLPPIGPISITVMHLPVLIGAIYRGPKTGLLLGLAFGLSSCFRALQGRSGIMSFIFMNPLISIAPRMIMGYLTGLIAEALRGRNRIVSIAAPALIGSLLNTIQVMGLIYIIYGQQYAQALKLSADAVIGAILSVCVINGIPEAIVASLLCVPIVLTLRRRD